jgi:hypothetical protein
MEQAISLVGALLILGAYASNQLGYLGREDRVYGLANLVGSVILTVVAFRASQWGFVLLEGVWAVLSVRPLLTRPR